MGPDPIGLMFLEEGTLGYRDRRHTEEDDAATGREQRVTMEAETGMMPCKPGKAGSHPPRPAPMLGGAGRMVPRACRENLALLTP